MKRKLLPIAASFLLLLGCGEAGSRQSAVANAESEADYETTARRITRRPDLVVTGVAVRPENPVVGDMVTFVATVKNNGTASTPAGTLLGVGYYGAQGAQMGFSATYTASLAPGAAVVLSSSQAWTATAGDFAVNGYVDDVNRIAELNESNNQLAFTVSVGAAPAEPTPTEPPPVEPTPTEPPPSAPGTPDLLVTGVTYQPASPKAGDTVQFSISVKNAGTGSTPAGTILGVGLRDGSGATVAFTDTHTAALAAGATVVLTTNRNWTAVAGTQTFVAHVDDVGRIPESNETNNQLGFSLAVAATATPPPDGGATPAPTNAKAAYRFLDTVGVNTHFGFKWTNYATQYQQAKARLLELGVKHIRDGSGGAADYKAGQTSSNIWNDLAASGIKVDIIGHVSWSAADVAAVLQANKAAVISMEGQNEAEVFVSGDWVTATRNFQKSLWSTVNSTAGNSGMPVLLPAMSQPYNYPTLGDLSAYGTHGNIHSYSGGQRPLSVLSNWVNGVKVTSGNLPLMATETGYHTAVNTSSPHLPISERGEAKYVPRLFLDYFNAGIVRTYLYQFLDHVAPSATDPEANFGLVKYDFSVRPAFTSLKNLLAVLQDSSANIPGGTLSYSLGGNTTNVRSALFQKTNGKFYLALWQDVSVWNTSTRQDIVNADAAVTVTFTAPKTAALYKPSTGTNPVATYAAASLTVNVPDEVVILEVAP